MAKANGEGVGESSARGHLSAQAPKMGARKAKWFIHTHVGILDPKHYAAMRDAIWLAIYFWHNADWDTGTVNWTVADAAGSIGASPPTIRKYHTALQTKGYVTSHTDKQRGYTVTKIHGWRNPKQGGAVQVENWPSNTPERVAQGPSLYPEISDSSEKSEGAHGAGGKPEQLMAYPPDLVSLIQGITGQRLTPRGRGRQHLDALAALKPPVTAKSAKWFSEWWARSGPFKDRPDTLPFPGQVAEYWERAISAAPTDYWLTPEQRAERERLALEAAEHEKERLHAKLAQEREEEVARERARLEAEAVALEADELALLSELVAEPLENSPENVLIFGQIRKELKGARIDTALIERLRQYRMYSEGAMHTSRPVADILAHVHGLRYFTQLLEDCPLPSDDDADHWA